jgi:2-keto-4-pentenoate hydratase/2-oxohepta-3-ene-1,7-dioic acid hydratase in catechol pathway
MTRWLRFAGGFGFLDGEEVRVCRGDLFAGAEPTGASLPVAGIEWLPPCAPSKMIALAGNFGEHIPTEPLYFIKPANTFAAHGAAIRKPRSFGGRVLFEGELGVVIGKAGRDIPLEAVGEHVFGYTCVNDVNSFELLKVDTTFEHWTRAKGFDTFGPFGPVIATDVDPAGLTVRTLVNGRERQSYRVADLIFSPARLVSLISRDVTLLPGDVISCGTGPGPGVMRPGATVEVVIDGVGTLSNRYEE